MNENNKKTENIDAKNYEISKNGVKKFNFKPLDFVFIAVALAAACFFFVKPSSFAGDDKKLVVFAGESQIQIPFVDQTIDFKKDFYDVDFRKHNINRNIIVEVKDKKARVVSSDCPDKVCVNSGWATSCGHMSICMPNSFAILIDCKGNTNENK